MSALDPSLDDFDVYDTFKLESERHDLELAYYYNPLESLRLVSGTSIRTDKVIADHVFDPNTDNSLMLYRFFTHGEYSLTSDWLINAGFMIEDNDISGTDLAPRLAIIHHLNEQHTFRLSASKATRTPTIFAENGYVALQQQITQQGGQPLNNPPIETALGGDVLVDPLIYTSGDLNSEEITSYELGWMAQLLDKKLIIDIKLFLDETENLISEVDYIGDVPTENIDDLDAFILLVFGDTFFNQDGAIDYTNAAGTETQGIEISSDYQIADDWRLYAYYAYIEITAKISNTDISTLNQSSIVGRLEESIPKQSFGAILMKQWANNLNTSLSFYYVADMDWLDRTSNRTDPSQSFRDRSAEEYTRIDFILRKSHFVGKNQVDYSFIVQNIGGSHFDYTRSNYTDPTQQTVDTPGSEQDPRGYFELAIKFN